MSHIFISHATADDAFVAHLHQRLEMLNIPAWLNIPVWMDSRNLRGGDALGEEGGRGEGLSCPHGLRHPHRAGGLPT
jgi:hypothetical protein